MLPIALDLAFYLKAAISIIAVFAVCITLHEFGHFYVAKKCGVAVPIFSIGFGPKLVKWRRGGTEYSVRLLPLGGFVQMAGEAPQETWFPVGQEIAYELDDNLEVTRLGESGDLPAGYTGVLRSIDLTDAFEIAVDTAQGVRTFQVRRDAKVMMNRRTSFPLVPKEQQVVGKPLWQRASIILAGPVMNFLLAGVLFAGVNTYTGVPTTVIGHVESNSPAQVSGLQPGDKIVRVNNHQIQNWNQLLHVVQSDPTPSGQPKTIQMSVLRSSQTEKLSIAPKLVKGRPLLGIEATVSHNPARTVPSGFTALFRDTALTVQGYHQLVAHHDVKSLSGPVGIADVITQQARVGFWHVVMIAGVLSLNLGLFNLIPIPALDGGRLLFMLIELVRGRKVDPQKEGFVHFVGFALLMLFAVVITYRDVTHLF